MRTVLFSVKDARAAAEIVGRVRKALTTKMVEPLYPGAILESMKREFYVALDDTSDVDEAVTNLRSVSGVESVQVPAPRRLIA